MFMLGSEIFGFFQVEQCLCLLKGPLPVCPSSYAILAALDNGPEAQWSTANGEEISVRPESGVKTHVIWTLVDVHPIV